MSSQVQSVLPDFMQWQKVDVFVGTGTTESLVAHPESVEDCRSTLKFCRANGYSICPRGSGRSYGDAILNDRHVVLDMSRMNRINSFDSDSGRVKVESGTRIVDIYAACHHLGFTLPASPTDSTISVGGALGANVNGKESWRAGNFGDQVLSITVMLASGEIRTLDRQKDRSLFLAVIGGMGLLGLVLNVTLQLQRVPSPFLDISTSAASNLDELIVKLDEMKDDADFIVVWIDGYARSDKLGRSVIHATRWVESDLGEAALREQVEGGVELLAVQKRKALAFYAATRPVINLGFHFQKIVFGLFNRFYYWLHNRRGSNNAGPELFLEHNFDKSYVVPPPDILCGPHGFTVQITIPFEQGRDGMAEMLKLCADLPCPPATTILRLHRKDDHLLSFSEDGYSLNIEIHPKKRHRAAVDEFLRQFIECDIRFGSKVHLPKDITLTRDQFRRLYPRYREFLDIKQHVDPGELFQSGMYRRLIAADDAMNGES